jgi:predicted ATPase
MSEKDFKFIAIRPLKQCSPKYSKILKPGYFYQFYSEFDFSKYDENGTIGYKKSVPDIYKLKQENGPAITISAIVGINGSGKSTIFELFYQFCFFVSMKLNMIDLSNFEERERQYINHDYQSMINRISAYRVELFLKKENNLFRIVVNDPIKDVFQSTAIENVHWEQLKQISDNTYQRNQEFNPLEPLYPRSVLANFFYTIAVNYSLYGLNEGEGKSWLKPLFHKNDGYQTPMVLNPYRKEGIIDINRESDLAKYRLLANALYRFCQGTHDKSTCRLTEKISIREVLIKINTKKIDIIAKHFYEKTGCPTTEEYFHNGLSVLDYAQKYDEYKLDQILKKYPKIVNSDVRFYNSEELPKSHIFFKIKQVQNFIKNNFTKNIDLYKKINSLRDEHLNSKQEFSFSLPEIVQWLQISSKDSLIDIYCKLPPAIFEFDFELTTEEKTSPSIKFSSLSSGESHMIFALQSVMYHVINILSAHNGVQASEPIFKTSANGLEPIDGSEEPAETRIVYQYVNIMLDEIELYFHPEYQRRFIKEFLDALNEVDYDKHIKGINILINTHSPFILSDIPKQNCLFLEYRDGYGIPTDITEMHTFGANVYDMLHNSFFMKNSMGAFAEEKINHIINLLSTHEKNSRMIAYLKEDIEHIQSLLREKGNEEYEKEQRNDLKRMQTELNERKAALEENKKEIRDNKEDLLQTIDLIDEDLLKRKLNEVMEQVKSNVLA